MSAEQIGPATYPAKRKLKKTVSFPKEIVEGVIASAIAEIKRALDDVYGALKSESPEGLVERIKANWLAIGGETTGVVALLEPYNDKALSPKHRASKAIFMGYLRRLEQNDLREDCGDERLALWAKDTVAFLNSVHMCMLESTDRRARYAWKRRFFDGDWTREETREDGADS